MNKEYKVFISSTSDLVKERARAIRAVLALNCIPVSMENWAATADDPQERIKEKLVDCDFFMLLAGYRYGEIAKRTQRSYVELEYEEASNLKLKRVILVYVKNRAYKIETAGKDSRSTDIVRLDSTSDDSTTKESAVPAINGAQARFREHLSRHHTIQVWRDPSDVSSLVMSSLFEIITDRESAAVFAGNADLVTEIGRYLTRAAKRGDRLKAHVIQYTAVNAIELVRPFLLKDIRTDLYVTHPARLLNHHQRKRWDENYKTLCNSLHRAGNETDFSLLQVFGYYAPGSLRAVMIERFPTTNDGKEQSTGEPDFLAVGLYIYMKMPLHNEAGKLVDELDIRGGEMPLVVLRPQHQGFRAFAQMVGDMLENWKAWVEPLNDWRFSSPH
jgi:hypothetical protein